MSSIYATQPPTRGKVVLDTSLGEIEIELWPKEAPKACRNFVQLCLEGYYTGVIFHRVMADFLVQTGDRTGSGTGGESVYGEPFPTETHSRLRFNARGMVATAGRGDDTDSNDSQFFITLDRSEFLNGKHSIFGRVVGDTLYNVMRIGRLETDRNDRPLYPPVIRGAEVLNNPFHDVTPRDIEHPPLPGEEEGLGRHRSKETKKKKKKKAARTKNLGVLSFGGEIGDTGDDVANVRIRNAHDVLDDPSLSKETAPEVSTASSRDNNQDARKNRLKEAVRGASRGSKEGGSKVRPSPEVKEKDVDRTLQENPSAGTVSEKGEMPSVQELEKEAERDRRESLRAEYERLRNDEMSERKAQRSAHLEAETHPDGDSMSEEAAFLAAQRSKYTKRGQRRKQREKRTLERLERFRSMLQGGRYEGDEEKREHSGTSNAGLDTHLDKEGTDGDDQDDNDGDWMQHRLRFHKDQRTATEQNEETLTVYDPLGSGMQPPQKRRRRDSKRQRR